MDAIAKPVSNRFDGKAVVMLGVIATIPVGGFPTEVVVSPDGTRAYVVNYHEASVSVIDTNADTVIGTIPVLAPNMMNLVRLQGAAVSPDGGHLYVVSIWGYKPADARMWVIDTATLAPTGNYPVGDWVDSVVIHPDGTRLYLGCSKTLTVKVFDVAMKTVTGTIDIDDAALTSAISPDGQHVYTTSYASEKLSVINTESEVVTSISFGAHPPGVSYYPHGVAVSPDSKQLYVANVPYISSAGPGAVFVIDAATNTVTGTPIPVGTSPYGIAVSPDGTSVYVTDAWDGTLTVIDTAAGQVDYIENVGKTPARLAVSPDGSRVYVPNSGDNTVSVLKQFPPPLPHQDFPDLDLAAKLFGGITRGGGGWLVVGNHAYKIPPRPLAAAAIARAAAPYLSELIENPELSRQLRNMP